jgi:hypothetical protein
MGGSAPYTHPLVVETIKMVEHGTWWCSERNDPEGQNFPELEYIPAIQRYLKVDADDPTRIVDSYINSWWSKQNDPENDNSYPFASHDFLMVHRPQVSNMLLSFNLSQVSSDPVHLERPTAGPICRW